MCLRPKRGVLLRRRRKIMPEFMVKIRTLSNFNSKIIEKYSIKELYLITKYSGLRKFK